VTRITRCPSLLIIAGILAFFAVVAYVIGDFKDRAQRRDAILREQGFERARVVRLFDDRAQLDSRDDKVTRDRADLHGQYNTIIQSLQRIEKAVQSPSR
jgi:arginine/ornithine N-succinyltransferase beta subunit